MENESLKKGIDLFVFFQCIWGRRCFIIKSICVGFVLGILISYSIPKQFQSEAKLVINENLDESKDQGMSVATLMGLNIKDISAIQVSKDMYPEIIKSTEILSELAKLDVSFEKGQKITLFDYVINYQKDSWWNKVLDLPKIMRKWFFDSDENFVQDMKWDNNYLSLAQQHFIDYLRKNVQVETNINNAIIYIRVSAQNAVIAAEIANAITQKLEKRISRIQNAKLERELLVARKMYENAENEYRMMIERYKMSEFKDKMQDNSPVKLDIALNLYNMLARQYEIMKVNASVPYVAFEILQPAVASDIIIAPNKKKIVIGFMFALGLLATLWSLFKQAWEIDYKRNNG